MPSPFPGMDPYLEQYWGDVHSLLVICARNQLQRSLPKDLQVRIEKRMVIAGSGTSRRARTSGNAAGPVAEPTGNNSPTETETQTYVAVREVSDESSLITVVEVLTPSNKKRGKARNQYLLEQAERLRSGINLVEIDFLRNGSWVVAYPLKKLRRSLQTPYRAVVRREGRFGESEYYPVLLMNRLPTITVPLRPDDGIAPLDLQALIDQCYDDGAYHDIDYSIPPEPPLPPGVELWADELLRRAGRRSATK